MRRNFITLGTFDGVHRGHHEVLACLRREAKRAGMSSLALYFPVPPKAVLSGDTDFSLITLPAEREKLILGCGIDAAKPLKFKGAVSRMGARDFVRKVLIKRFKMGGLLVGRDFALGRGREGHLDFLRRECRVLGVRFIALPFVKSGGHKIASSVIRRLLREGHVEDAAVRLGRFYSVCGKVVKGAGLGRKLGYPTANIDAGRLKILPHGVFAIKARLGARSFDGVASVGLRPTVNAGWRKSFPLLEAHLFGFNENIYSRRLAVEFRHKIRNERKFASLAELSAQIKEDVKQAKYVFALGKRPSARLRRRNRIPRRAAARFQEIL